MAAPLNVQKLASWYLDFNFCEITFFLIFFIIKKINFNTIAKMKFVDCPVVDNTPIQKN